MKKVFNEKLQNKPVGEMKHNGAYVIIVCVCMTAAYSIILRLMNFLVTAVFPGTADSYWLEGILRLIMAGVLYYVLLRLNKGYLLKERGTGFVSGIKAGVFHLVIIFAAFLANMTKGLSEGQLQSFGMILGFAVASFAVGLAEELLDRGIILNVLLDRYGRNTAKGVWMSVLISGAIFGLSHISNIFTDGRTISSVIVQCMYAASVGFYFGAVYMRCGNLWVLILLHSLNDFVVEMRYGVWGIGSEVAIANTSDFGKLRYAAIFIVLTFFLLRKKKMTQIIERNR